jgi:hypothetical protein
VEFALSDTPEERLPANRCCHHPFAAGILSLAACEHVHLFTTTASACIARRHFRGTDHVSVAGIHRDVRLFALNGTAVTVDHDSSEAIPW